MQDSNARSFAKGVTWRVVGTLDTLMITFLWTGSLVAGVSVAGSEVFTKILLFYLHERGWNGIPWGRKSYGPTKWRSVTKMLSWRALGTLDTMLVAYINLHFFGKAGNEGEEGTLAAKIGGSELITKPILYYFHERAWGHVKWGRIKGSVNPSILNKDMLDALNIEDVKEIARKAGAKIMDIYENEDFEKTVDFKSDDSPLTVADKASHEIINHDLELLNLGIAILSEEGAEVPYETRSTWKTFWCVDPLDGTKEFINKNGEFTVNIALIREGEPVLGVVYAPAINTMYYGKKGEGAFMQKDGEEPVKISVNHKDAQRVAVRSKSHANPAEEEVLEQYDVVDTISVGSSLKFCMVAEGKADLYYRHGPTMEWDTAAGQAVVEAAGGKVLDGDTAFRYNKESLLNGSFLCVG